MVSKVFIDTLQNYSEPQYEFAANTGNNVQYIYSRVLKNKKQVIYDVVTPYNGTVKTYPIVSKLSYEVLINSGKQISPDIVVFPYLNYRKVGFVRLSLK